VAEDARAAARRIVEEVLAAHGQAAPAEDVDTVTPVPAPVDAAVSAGGGPDDEPFSTVDPRTDAVPEAALPDALADRPSRAVARRIVEEVLAAHAAAEREVDLPAAAAEAAGPPPLPDAIPVQPVPGRDAVVPGVPASAVAVEVPTEPDAGTVADDAASIARRIVADVLADAEARAGEERASAPVESDGPPAIPADDPEATQALRTDEIPEGTPAADVGPADADATQSLVATDAPTAAPAADDPEATQALVATEAPAEDDADATQALVAVDEPEDTGPEATSETDATIALPAAGETPSAPEPADEPLVDGPPVDGPPVADTPDVAAAATVDGQPDDADTTVPLVAEGPSTDAGAASSAVDHGVDEEADDRRAVATLPPRTDASAEVTAPVPAAEPPTRRTHWLLASILGAIGLAVLLPLAVAALRSLVELS
jgi:trimeric autotransporter adhesin